MTETATDDIDRKRSPGYPVISLEDAIAKAQQLYDQDRQSPATVEVIASHWNSKASSSAFLQWLASLKRFGLLVEAPTAGDKKQFKLSAAALDILLLPPEDGRRKTRIKEAALLPKAHADLWQQYHLELPSEANLRHQLVTVKGYKHDSADDLIKQYKKTLAFAKLEDGDKIENEVEDPKKEGVLKPQTQQVVDVFNDIFNEPSNRMTGAVHNSEGSRGSTPPPVVGQKQFPIDLMSGKNGFLSVPASMSGRDYELLKLQVEHYLKLLKLTSVSDGSGTIDGVGLGAGTPIGDCDALGNG